MKISLTIHQPGLNLKRRDRFLLSFIFTSLLLIGTAMQTGYAQTGHGVGMDTGTINTLRMWNWPDTTFLIGTK